MAVSFKNWLKWVYIQSFVFFCHQLEITSMTLKLLSLIYLNLDSAWNTQKDDKTERQRVD